MIDLYTSHWRSRLIEDADAVVVSIFRGEPRWRLPFAYRRLRELAPCDAAWNAHDGEVFERAYLDQLAALGARRILDRLTGIGDGRAVVMLCWERDPTDPETPCHRRYLSGFLEREAGVVVPELAPGDLPRREDAPEMRLF